MNDGVPSHEICPFCAVVEFDADGYVRTWSDVAERIEGYTAEEAIGKHFTEFYAPEALASGEPQRRLEQAKSEGRFWIEEVRVRKGGEPYWALVTVNAIRNDSGDVIGFSRITRDINHRKAMQTALQATRQQEKLLQDYITDYAIFQLDLEGRVKTWNIGARKIKGYSADEIIGRHFSVFYTEEDRQAGEPQKVLAEARQNFFHAKALGVEPKPCMRQGWRVRKDGTRFYGEITVGAIGDGSILGYYKIVRDRTEQHQADCELSRTREALVKAQRMEAFGQVAGGIAHDFNNLLNPIMAALDAVRVYTDSDRSMIEAARRATMRGKDLIQQLLAFTRQQPMRLGAHNPNRLIASFEKVLRLAAGPTVKLEIDCDPALRSANIDEGQFQNALLNLVKNAADAMPTGGKIQIKTQNAAVEQWRALRLGLKPDKKYVSICVADAGCGMAPEVIERAFDPFFTTKEPGKGTGLGLSQVHGFVMQSGGQVEIKSALGAGTAITMYLPAVNLEVVSLPPFEQASDDGIERRHGSVLLVDDDEDILATSSVILRDMGYDVTTAAHGDGAMLVLRSRQFDILFTDYSMPGAMNGVRLAKEARALWPKLRVVVASGYKRRMLDEMGVGALDDCLFLEKPYRTQEMADILAEAMAKEP